MYSIWLLPSETESQRYQQIISTLSQEFKAPVFEPHITLYTNIPTLTDELFYKISVLAALTNTFDVSINDFQTSTNYFKSLFVTIENKSILTELQQEVQNLFVDANYEFEPHLSLLYSDDAEETSKQSTIATIKAEFANTFKAMQIAIVTTKGDVNDWKILETFDLHETQNSHLEFVFDTVKNLKV